MSLGRLTSSIAGRIQERRAGWRRSQTLRLPGLSEKVEVFRDEAGTPHVYAQNRLDLFRAQGFVVARERGFQLDFSRRAVGGRLAEILGPRPVGWESLTVHLRDRTVADADLLLRTLGLYRAAEASLERLLPESRAVLDAYADGVSAAFARMKRRLPFEMRLLGYRPEPWRPADSIAVLKGMAFELSLAWRAVILFDAIARRLGDDRERLMRLFPQWPEHAPPPAAWNTLRDASAEAIALEESFRSFTALGGAHVGSNAWVVSGALTASGKPILCGDPHLMLTAPSPHFAIHLSCPDLEVAGSAVPGIPGVIIGHNRDIAWSMTSACGSDADVFVEEFDLERSQYRTGPDTWAPLETRIEIIHVKGEASPRRHLVRSTRHGPLIHDVTRSLGARPRFGHALSWTGMDASRDLDGLLQLQTAACWSDLRAALRHHHAPAVNFVYADRAGHIGWQLAGAFPVREDGSDGSLPTDGASDHARWSRYLTLDELPHLFDPPTHQIVSANTKPVDDRYPWPLGHTFEPYFRYQRIQQLLSARAAVKKLEVEDMPPIQMDQRSLWAERVLDRFLRPALSAAPIEDPLEKSARDILLGWDGEARVDSVGAAIFYVTFDRLMQAILRREIEDDLLFAYLELTNLAVLPMERLLETEDPPLLPRADRPAVAHRALRAAIAELRARLGPDPARWRWGAIHPLWHRHRMHEVVALRPMLSIGPFAVGGDGMTVNNAFHLHSRPFEVVLGAGLRVIIDLADFSRSRFILNSGSSGNPASPRYRDHAARWAEGRYFPLRFGADGRIGAPEELLP